MTIQIKYFDKTIDKVTKIEKGDWIDLRSAEEVTLKQGQHYLIPLGVGMILPPNYEAHLAPRSSTFGKYGILIANSFGVIDNTYSGDADEWKLSVYATRDIVIPKNERICQFRIIEKQPEITFIEVDHLREESRGGFGSTGDK